MPLGSWAVACAPMLKSLALFSLLAALALAGCSSTPKPSASFHQGDGPSIHYTDEPETAGGTVKTTVYH